MTTGWTDRPAWALCACLIAAAVVAPVVSLAWTATGSGLDHWDHLLAYVFWPAARNTLSLLLGVGVASALVGTACAWLVTRYEFPGRRVLQWALLLPMAVPTYIVAYAYVDLLHPIGPFQSALRAWLGYETPRQFRLPDLRHLPGAIFVLTTVLFPYVYLSMRAMFMVQPARLLEAARVLGEGPWGVFRRVALPMARPALAVGVSLVLMEVLNDVGASEFMGVGTLTTSVYATWITRSDLAAASQIALLMLSIVVIVIAAERLGRRRQRQATTMAGQTLRRTRPGRLGAWAVTLAVGLPVLTGFVVPAGHLLVQAWRKGLEGVGWTPALGSALASSVGLAVAATAGAVAAGLVVAWAARRPVTGGRAPAWLAALASLGYAVPGTVLAIGMLVPANRVDAAFATLFGLPGLPLAQAGVILAVAYGIRFLALPIGGVQAGLSRLAPQLEQVSRSLGEGATRTLWRVHLPLLRPALGFSALLVFIDVMKELPIALLLRPANVETLATLLYAEAARGQYENGALAALIIVAAGVPAVVLLNASADVSGRGATGEAG